MIIKHKFETSEKDFKMEKNKRINHAKSMRKYRKRIKDKVIPTPAYLKFCKKNPHYHNEYYKTIKYDVISHYTKGKNSCKCCGESTKEFLSIDHIHGGGKKHRKEIKVNIYWWLKKNKYPKGFQVLCHNCNQAKGWFGECPHKKLKKK